MSGGSPRHRKETQMQDSLTPLSPKHAQSTTKRALASAVPLRDELQARVDELQKRVIECHAVDTDVSTEIAGLEAKREAAYRQIVKEFEAKLKMVTEAMEARKVQLSEMATAHFLEREQELKSK